MGHLGRGLLLLTLLLVCASQAWAEFSLTPGIRLRQEYNDNVDLDASDEEDDFITTITPRISLLWKIRDVDLSLTANVDIKKYWKNTNEDSVDANAEEASELDSTFDLYQGIVFLRVADTYERVTIDEGGRGGQDNNVTNQTDSNRLVINPYLQFAPTSDLQIKLGYSYKNQWYEDEDGDDAEYHIYDLVITKGLTDRVVATLSGSHLQFRPKNPSERRYVFGEHEGTYEYDRDSVRVGLNYQVSEKLQVKGGYGHSWLNYDVREDTDSDTWDVSADYELSSTLKTGIAYRLDYSISVEDGPSERDHLSAYIAYDDRIKIRASAFMASNNYVEINREDDSYGGNISGTLPFTDRFGLDGGLRYTNYDESGFEGINVNGPLAIDISEEYDRYGARLALYYDISMGRLSAGWTWTRNESDLDDEDYTNNIIYLQANLTF